MARFGSTVAIVVGHQRYKAGTTFADSKANAIGNDVIWVGLSSASMSPGLIPLDGTATSMKAASVYSGISIARPDGANSIEG
jgi:hypothetical protein